MCWPNRSRASDAGVKTLIKTVFNGWTQRNLCFYRYLPYAYRFSSLNNRSPIRRWIHRFILRVFIFHHRIFNLKELDSPTVYTRWQWRHLWGWVLALTTPPITLCIPYRLKTTREPTKWKQLGMFRRIAGSVVESPPTTRETRARFLVGATPCFHTYPL